MGGYDLHSHTWLGKCVLARRMGELSWWVPVFIEHSQLQLDASFYSPKTTISSPTPQFDGL